MNLLNILTLLNLPSLVFAKLGGTHHNIRSRRHLKEVKYTDSFPLGRCEGDCDSNDDCEAGLICFQRDENESVPGCSGGSSDGSRTDYCIYDEEKDDSDNNNNELKFSTDFPLPQCHGDCDSDSDCRDGLRCFQRDEHDPVPGCQGGEEDGSRTDYCVRSVDHDSDGDDLHFSKNFPLPRCYGDCDSDDDCRDGLVCHQRDQYEPVPGCSGGEDDASRTDYCVDDALTAVTEMSSMDERSGGKELLSECEADCDYNEDCDDGLFCWQRDKGEDVPGCPHADSSHSDYCVAKSKAPAKKLKLYWEPSYYWQESHEETFWCMTCAKCDKLTTGDGWEGGCQEPKNNECHSGDLLWIQRCRETTKRFEIVGNDSNNSANQIRLHDSNLCLSTIRNRYLELRTCNKNSSRQQFARISNRDKFELRPYEQRHKSRNSAKCLSQLHHPKATEVIALRTCSENIRHDTNYWTEYYG